MSSAFHILRVERIGTAFEIAEVDPALWRHATRDDPESFSVAVVPTSLDGAGSDLAFGCDFMAVAPDAELVILAPAMIRRRAGRSLGAGSIVPDRMPGATLHALGLAAILIDGANVRHQVLAQADTMLALKQARRVSDPDWFAQK